MSENCPSKHAYEVKFQHITDRVGKLEANRDEDRKLLTEVIIEMKENNIKLTSIIESNNEDLSSIKTDISDLKQNAINKKNNSSNKFVDAHSGKIIFALIVIIAGLLGINVPM